MILWLLLVSLFCRSTQEKTGGEDGVPPCGPQNLILTNSNSTMILLTWEDEPSCSTMRDGLIYELLLLVADEQVHHEEFAVMPDHVGSTHSWNWTSHVAPQCAPHSVRLRSRYKNNTSPWKQAQTPGIENKANPEVFPRDNLFKVGSRATFCCILPAAQIFSNMSMDGNNDSEIRNISDRIYTLTVNLTQASKSSCTNVICKTTVPKTNGACAYIGYQPDIRDLECETQDLQSVECHWTEGRKTHMHKSPTVYQLLGRDCVNGSMGRCRMEVQVDAGERNWTVTAKNALGKVELSESADLSKRVHMIAPKKVTTSVVNARNVTLEWEWMVQKYNNLKIRCEVKVSDGERKTRREIVGVGLRLAVLTDLRPLWPYQVTVRCGTAQKWKWSDWSTNVSFFTRSDVPDAPDVWMQVEGNQVVIVWRADRDGYVRDYEVTWAKTKEKGQEMGRKVDNKYTALALSLDTTKEYIVTVTASNINGSSSPSTIIIPSHNPDRTKRVNTSWITGRKGSFSLSWSASPISSCGYIVDWCPTSGPCGVEWLKVPPNATNVTIFSEKFMDGVRYSLSVYACTREAPVLLEIKEGYVKEKRIENGLFKSVTWKQENSDVVVSWDSIILHKQSAFIQGYVLHCIDINGKNVSFSTDNPEATRLTARNLNFSSYTFKVLARTAVGECGTTQFTATLNSLTDDLVTSVFISLVTIFAVLSLITILCYKHWTCIKQKVYPPIPKPVLKKWLTSVDENGCCRPYLDPCHHGEVDIVEVSKLHCNSEAQRNSYVNHKDACFVYSQAPKDYYKPVSECISPALLPQSELPYSSFSGVFPNPLFNLMMQSGNQPPNFTPEHHGRVPLERSSSGYQQQSPSETISPSQITWDTESQMSCDSAYILLPQS